MTHTHITPMTQLVLQVMGTNDIALAKTRLVELFSQQHPHDKAERMAKHLLQPRMVPVYVLEALATTSGVSQQAISTSCQQQLEFIRQHYPDNLPKGSNS